MKPNQSRSIFGDELPVIAGSGDCKEAPFVIDVATADDAYRVMVEVHRRIGMAQGKYWRTLGCDQVPQTERPVFRYVTESREFSNTKIFIDGINRYFTLSDEAALSSGTSHFRNFIQPAAGLLFPDEIGWLHRCGDLVDYESESPGLGWSHAYDCVGGHATLYTYDKGKCRINPEVNSPDLLAQFEESMLAIAETNPGLKAWGESQYIRSVLTGGFLLQDRFSVICLGARENRFLKLRITFAQNSNFYDLCMDCITSFCSFVEKGPDHRSWSPSEGRGSGA